jgi:rubrerythrin
MPKSSTQSPIDDLTYDVIAVLHHKGRALKAYDKYLADAEAEDDVDLKELFLEMRRQDTEHALVLKEALARRLDEELGYDEDLEDVDVDEYDEVDEVEVEEPTSTSPIDAARGSSSDRQR